MRPGPHQFAMDDTWTAGPDIGSETKAELPQADIDEGFYGGQRVAPNIFNYLEHKQSLTYDFVAKILAGNWTVSSVTAFVPANSDIMASSHLQRTGDIDILLYGTNPAGGANLDEIAYYSGVKHNVPVLASNPVLAIPAGAVTAIDADADDVAGYRCVVINSAGGTDQVRYATGFGGGAWGASAIGGAPALNWQAIGCDRRTTGGANSKWLIGDDAGGGNAVIYASSGALGAPTAFANVAGFPALGGAEQIRFIGHTCHPADAVNTDDPGNPSWLVLTDSRACVSADGVTWSNAAHGFGFVPHKKTAAYSRTARRWVACRTGSANIYYSDDNGVTWSSLLGILPGTVVGGNRMEIQCDGYGTFVVKDKTVTHATLGTGPGTTGMGRCWISTDDGMTWTQIIVPATAINPAAANLTFALEVGFYSVNAWKDPGEFGTFFFVCFGDRTTLEPIRSLLY